ncbi:MAG TPA: L,D-transpeptidase family protein [Acidimicrobiales bacterium]|nr:L,D-transpeptidase family protein [Acidimicrobiales bacterium]
MSSVVTAKGFAAGIVLVIATGLYVTSSPSRADAPTPGQVITVQAPTAQSQTAVLRTWQLESTGRYVQVWGPVIAFVGESGVGPTREGLGRTPDGVFALTQAFGNQPDNGTRLPYFRAGVDDWWDENSASRLYNRHVKSSVSPGGASENLFDAGRAYAHAVVINYNTDPVVKGAGSGFFLHVSLGAPTEGCVAIPEGELNRVMRWLLPRDHPVISIGVGAAPLAPVRISS